MNPPPSFGPELNNNSRPEEKNHEAIDLVMFKAVARGHIATALIGAA